MRRDRLVHLWVNIMKVFLTSSPTGPLDGAWKVEGFDEANQFRANLKKYWKADARCLIISAFPDRYDADDEMADFMHHALEDSGLSVGCFDIWDNRTADFSAEKLHSYDVVLLGGGHVPTQHAFFERIGLRNSIQGFDGIVIGISAGTMNSADIVYAQPEEAGEAVNPYYEKFFPGLGLTPVNILPHYQMVKHYWLDGMRLFEDITYGDSYGNEFLALKDGSYLLIEDGRHTVYGEAYRIADGEIEKICEEEQSVVLF